jgi:hypothetical protein
MRTTAVRRRGVALIVVLAVLTLLAGLAVAFSTLQATERRIARNFLDSVRARLAAQSGVETAIARLREIAWRAGPAADGVWRCDSPSTPLERLREPSFAERDDAGLPRTLMIGGAPAGLSGTLDGGAYAFHGDLFTLRVTDESSRINVNDGAAWGPDHSVSRNLRRLLNVLGAQPSVGVPGLGDRVLAARPPGGYAHKVEILRALEFDRASWERVRDFVTVCSWTDPDVANPVPLSEAVAGEPWYPVAYARPGGRYRHGHQTNFRGEAIAAPLDFHDPAAGAASGALWGRDSVNPGWIEIVARSPVNVNTARREVLVALLVDLEGFFVLERRRELPGGYAWSDLRYTYDATGTEGDECGFLRRTFPLVGPGGRRTEGVSAEAVADEILACRGSRPSPRVAGLDYANAPFGGPFRSWSQFNLFVDTLVRGGLLADDRPGLYWDAGPAGVRVPSEIQRRLASEAIGDVLKANFNPNLHLNEINPNRNLFTHVDKTDLLVNSTEICFTPMGTFEIEAAGLILQPADGARDAFTAADNAVVACQKASVHVRVFDALRHTNQSHFAAGEFSERRIGAATNNNWSLEAGPEPDNGPAPAGNEYEGYLQLPTYGSTLFARGLHKPGGALWTTLTDPAFYPGAATMKAPSGGPIGSVIHSHFTFDHAAHHHASRNALTSPPSWDGFRLPQGAWWTVFGDRACLNANVEDRGEPLKPPYSPVDSARAPSPDGPRYRIARSFRPPGTPAPSAGAPVDLRVDGAYVERHSAFGYWIDEDVSFNFNEGSLAFWLKPGFFPETTGKSRTLVSMSRYHAHAPGTLNPSPFALFFVPGAAAEGSSPVYGAGAGAFLPCSLAFGYGYSADTGYAWETGGPKAAGHALTFTPTLNHEGHGPDNASRLAGDDGRFNFLRAHEWTHVAATWHNPPGTVPSADTLRVYVNGRVLPGALGFPHLYPDGTHEGPPFESTPPWAVHSLQASVPGTDGAKWAVNSIRLGGEPSTLFHGVPGLGPFPRNFSADATFDEFFLWTNRSEENDGGVAGIEKLWTRGRYYRPYDTNPADARFRSAPIALPAASPRVPPPSIEASSAPSIAPAPDRPRVLAVAWTEVAEDYDREGSAMRPKMYDYATEPPSELRPPVAPDMNGFAAPTVADLSVEVGGALFGPYRNEAWSAVHAPSGAPPEILETDVLRYRAKLKMGGSKSSGVVLLSTPILDDVTLYLDPGRPEILSWAWDPAVGP